jgi:hypothetical protein
MYPPPYSAYFWIEKECLLLELDFEVNHAFSTSTEARKDYFQGTVHQVTPEFMARFLEKRQRPEERHIVRVVEKVSGRWSQFVTFHD